METLKHTRFIIAAGIVLLFASCTDFLDIKPFGKTIPKTTEEFSALVNNIVGGIDGGDAGGYNAEALMFGSSDVQSLEQVSDNLETNLTEYPLGDMLKYYFGDVLSSSWYDHLYEVISRCNMVFDEYEEGRDTREGKDLLGTCHALRGVAYYQLLRLYCAPPLADDEKLGVPLVTKFDMEAKPLRSSVDETVAQAESDLKEALKYDIQDEMYRFNNDVVNGYLARLYFWAGRFSEAKAIADELLAKHPLLRGDAYEKMITAHTGLVGNMLIRCDRLENDGYGISNQYLQARPLSARFVNLFAEKDRDIRYRLFFNYRRRSTKAYISSLRSAELALISMESACHLGDTDEALRMLNQLRACRISDYVPYTMSTLPVVDKTALVKTDCMGKPLTPLMQAILNERRKELYLEGDRFFELKRNGRPEFWVMKKGLKYTNYKYMYTFPIPPNDIVLTPGLKQNPGYTEMIY